eukprot:CAMPEP_0196688268 /NCGR_PEP_ID=MMETSP1090-20130531/15893_1 /TAXON_ID=37098 /ORGANISM="Isochrysis sp, Strain CCMP1244" /LENGTH=474 /DNA_ID=CAMNT_0042027143 /DNA_START=34 /DNA_END=1458 /DNA_ORIENTATION=+
MPVKRAALSSDDGQLSLLRSRRDANKPQRLQRYAGSEATALESVHAGLVASLEADCIKYREEIRLLKLSEDGSLAAALAREQHLERKLAEAVHEQAAAEAAAHASGERLEQERMEYRREIVDLRADARRAESRAVEAQSSYEAQVRELEELRGSASYVREQLEEAEAELEREKDRAASNLRRREAEVVAAADTAAAAAAAEAAAKLSAAEESLARTRREADDLAKRLQEMEARAVTAETDAAESRRRVDELTKRRPAAAATGTVARSRSASRPPSAAPVLASKPPVDKKTRDKEVARLKAELSRANEQLQAEKARASAQATANLALETESTSTVSEKSKALERAERAERRLKHAETRVAALEISSSEMARTIDALNASKAVGKAETQAYAEAEDASSGAGGGGARSTTSMQLEIAQLKAHIERLTGGASGAHSQLPGLSRPHSASRLSSAPVSRPATASSLGRRRSASGAVAGA